MKKSTRLNTRHITRTGRKVSAAILASAIMAGGAIAAPFVYNENGGTYSLPGAEFHIDGIILEGNTTLTRAIPAGQVTVGLGSFFDLRSGEISGGNILTGVGSLIKTSTGTVTIHNSQNYTGSTTIEEGVLRIRAVGALGTSDVVVDSLGELEISLTNGSNFVRNIDSDGVISVTNNNPAISGDQVELSGVIDSFGLFVQASDGITTISNVNSYINDLSVVDGTLAITNSNVVWGDVGVGEFGVLDLDGTTQWIDGLFGLGEISLNSGTLIVEDGVFGGNILGDDFSALVKTGDGNLFLDGVVDFDTVLGDGFAGDIVVEDGGLFVNGTVFSDVEVTRNPVLDEVGRLHGTGVIVGNVFNNGILSPGNPLDRSAELTITEDLFLGPDSIVGIHIDNKRGPGIGHDHIAVGGDAFLDGALIVHRNSSYRPRANKSFTVLSTGGDVYNTFDIVRSSWDHTMLRLEASYKDDAVVLTLKQRSFANLKGLTPNQRRIGKALNHASRKGQLKALLDNLNYTHRKDVPAKLQLLSAENMTAIFNIGFATSQIQNVNIERRLDDVRAGSVGFDASGLAITNSRGTINYDGAPIANTADGLTLAGWDGGTIVSKEVVAPVIEQSRWGFFATGTGEWVDIENTHDARGEGFRSAGFTLGADYRVSENLVVGLNAGYTNTSADLPGNGSIEVDGGRGGVYATAFGGGAYVNAAVGGGYNSYRTRRATLGGKAHGDTDGAEFNALLGGGYDFNAGGFTVGPIASVQFTYIGLNAYQETGSLAPQDFRNQNQESLRTLVGARAAYTIETGGVVIKPEVRAQWKHEYLDAAPSISSSFVGSSSVFDADGVNIGRDSLVLDAGASVQFNSSVAVYAYYTGELGRSNYESHAVNGGFRVAF